ncbi:MAG TPA: ribosome biogenesis GTP-binding protein YihA/YsxC [Bryobacterales bacterium]|nr:ribosome biogenesis GTP-binding protein YihA/YsxC [Bryobacterales bacterium]
MSAEFILSASSPDQFPRDGRPEIAFIGRSNVGKSSLLNTLTRRVNSRGGVQKKELAHVSRTPGRTQAVNFFLLEGRFYFVDLPGYGYAKAPRRLTSQWGKLAEGYLLHREPLKLVVLIVDVRHGPTVLDHDMKDWLVAHDLPFVVAASKSDKLKAAERVRATRAVQESFGRPTILLSAKTAEGIPALWDGIFNSLNA